MSLAVLVPTKGRPENAVRLAKAVRETAGQEMSALWFLTDAGEPAWDEYHARLQAEAPWAFLEPVKARPQRVGPVLNAMAPNLTASYSHLAFMGDDHLPQIGRAHV